VDQVLLDDGAARRADLDLVALGRVVAVAGRFVWLKRLKTKALTSSLWLLPKGKA
jgi:hypothetical protein